MPVHLTQDLASAQQTLLRMGGLVGHVVHTSLEILQRAASDDGAVPAEEREIDRIDVDMEEACLRMLALYQPVASDLRQVATMLKISTELERIGDLAQNITERAAALRELPPIPLPPRLLAMAQSAAAMVDGSLRAYADKNPLLARRICEDDESLDQLNREIIDELTATMRSSPQLVDGALQLFSVSRHLERIGDHATNIAEDVIYLVRGEIVRHRQAWGAEFAATPPAKCG